VQWLYRAAVASLGHQTGHLEIFVPQRPLVAIIDDDDSIRAAISNLLEASGYSTTRFSSAEGFLSSARRRRVCCIVADMRMPGMTGLELFGALAASGGAIPTVLVTAYPDESARLRARQMGINCYLSKPFAPDELCACVETAISSRAIRKS
jgi:FixJ family two-component response regulator